MAGKYDGLARIILQNVGGKENIESLTHCVSRLRFRLKEEEKANTDILKNTEGVVTVIQSGGQYMVVIGNQVTDVYESLVKCGHLENISEMKHTEEETGKKQKPFDYLVGVISGVLQPILPVICASGILKGVLAFCVAVGILNNADSTYQILNSLSDAVFFYLPIVLGITAAEKFGISKFEGFVIGATLMYPAMLSTSGTDVSHLFGIPVLMPASGDYSSSVIPVICSVAFAGWLEKKYKKYIPETIKMFTVPLITCLVTVCLTLWIIGPIASGASSLLGTAFMAIYDFNPVIMGVIVGGLWQVLVIFGLHWAIVPIMINNLATLGFDMVQVGQFGATFVTTGAVIAIMLKTKDKHLKSMCFPAIISGLAGVTEPAIYGITLPKKKPFVLSCVISAVAGGAIAFFDCRYWLYPGMGVFGYTSFINVEANDSSGMIAAIIISILSLLAGTIIIYLAYQETKTETVKIEGTPVKISESVEGITAPLKGKVMQLSEVKDEAFSSGALGEGAAILPEEGRLYAPVDGTVSVLFPTGHAIGISTEDGMELLMHVGMDTVKLDGKGFTPKIQQGDAVKRGDLLLEFDIKGITEAGFSVVTPVIVTDMKEKKEITVTEQNAVEAGDAFIQMK